MYLISVSMVNGQTVFAGTRVLSSDREYGIKIDGRTKGIFRSAVLLLEFKNSATGVSIHKKVTLLQ